MCNPLATTKNGEICRNPFGIPYRISPFDQIFFDFVPIYICFHSTTFAAAIIPIQNSSNSVDLFVVRTKHYLWGGINKVEKQEKKQGAGSINFNFYPSSLCNDVKIS